MTKKLSDFIIMSDVDGTLIKEDETIPQRNLDALQRFTKKGGKFGIATGRSKELTQHLVEQLPVNIACVLYNGGVLYDFANKQYIMELFLPNTAREYTREILKAFPKSQVMVVSNSHYYNVNEELAFAKYKKTPVETAPLDSLTDAWYKVLFLIDPELYEDFFAFTSEKAYDGVRFVSTNAQLIEMLPTQSSKGFALEELVRITGMNKENLAVIGDYYNDMEMIEYAGLGVTVAGAPEPLQNKADLVVGCYKNGAVADLIEYLEEHYSV